MDPFGLGLVPLEGGYGGETFLADVAGERTVVRIYADRGARRGPRAVEVDAAVLRLVRGLLPVPDVLEVRRPDPVAGTPALLVTSFLPGERLDLVLPGADPALRRRLGAHIGEVLARLAQMPMLRPGEFVDGELRLRPFPADDLVAWVSAHREGTALAGWDERAYDGLLRVADEAQTHLDRIHRACLVHSDFNAKNLLVDPSSGEVTALLDWEFAHSGAPVEDLGNLLRFEREPVFAEAVVAAYRTRVPDAPDTLLEQARAVDLFALVDLAARRDEHLVARRAHDQLLAIARSGDLDAHARLLDGQR
jgi:aminoglycoside phosphotransferase (APT) family kinase protein